MQTNVKSPSLGTISRVIYWGAIGAAVGAGCAAIYGFVFGEVEIQLVGAAWRLLPFAGYFAICGLVAGALAGAAAGFFDGHLGRQSGSSAAPTPGSESRRNDEPV